MKRFIIALVTGTAALATAQAQTMQSPRYYVGAGANFADHDYKLPGASNVRGDEYEAGYKLFGGADLHPLWGVEAGYTDFAKADFNYTQGFVPGHGTVDGYGVYFAGKARWPVLPMVDVYGKLGVAYSHRKLESNLPLTAAQNNDDTGVYAGAGLQWNITPQWALVGEYERYGRSKRIGSSADVWTVAARYNF
jgi:OOP family OmpA-OmpF porin